MSLPDLIEIEPLRAPVRARVTVPGSKSVTNRALVLAALARGRTTLRGALWSEDTQVMVEALRRLGFAVEVAREVEEPGNRSITVEGRGGVAPPGGSLVQPLELFVGNAGTAARFLTALLCLGRGFYRLHGTPRMHERPQTALFAALRALGYRIDAPNDRLPALVHGAGPRPGTCRVRIDESSQFASALLLSAAVGGWEVQVEGVNTEESPYVHMTRELVRAFPATGGECAIEADASSGSYFWAVNALPATGAASALPSRGDTLRRPLTPALSHPIREGARTAGEGDGVVPPGDSSVGLAWPWGAHEVQVVRWPTSGWQVDERFPRYLPLPPTLSRQTDLGDSIMTAMVLAPFAAHPTAFADLGRLRVQECERVAALRTELRRCGAAVDEDGDTLRVCPSALHGAEIETYGDHRMAMCFAILGLNVSGMRIKNPACVKKTFPDFFQKLAAPPPGGLGATLRDARTGHPLSLAELGAE